MSEELTYTNIYNAWDAADGADESFEDDASPHKKQHLASLLEETDLSLLFGADGPLAAQFEDFELRASQVEMAEAIKRALLVRQHALIEAPTGTGKSMAYLVPAILSGRTVVVATANKSLQSQLFTKELPLLRKILQLEIPAVVVKGRSNYVCNLKWEREEPVQRQMAMYDRENEQVAHLSKWLQTTATGDVDDLPFLLAGDLRPQVVSFTDDCLQRDCRHYIDNCWINHMRDAAAEAQVLITNHHLLLNALELGEMGHRILPPAAIYIIDEAHQLEQTATAVFETTVTDYSVEQLLLRAVLKERLEEEEIDDIRFENTLAFQQITHLSRDNSFRIESELESLKKLGRRIEQLGKRLKDENPYAKEGDSAQDDSEKRRAYELTLETVNSTARKLLRVATSSFDEETVRYAVRVFERRHITLELHAAPINPAALLAEHLFESEGDSGERSVICTSATLATNGNFEHLKRRCGIHETSEEQVMPEVFDYPHQALVYQPTLPPFNFRAPDVYYDHVSQEIGRLLEVSRGRTLCLFTSWSGLQRVKEHLSAAETTPIWPLRAQGDAPRDTLLSWFKETRYSVLLATRSFWEGVDIPGDDLSLVVLDKLPFPTPSDPLHSARMKAVDEAGESSFGQYMLPLMTLALKQGFGRLVRRSSDRGVVAILDERLTSKGYGRQARRDLPNAPYSRAFEEVHRFFEGALQRSVHFALNVWADDPGAPQDAQEGEGIQWRWQLWRLPDGKSDSVSGWNAALDGAIEGEIYAALRGMENLQERIERANRKTTDFSVEVRCSAAAAARLQEESNAAWSSAIARWQAVELLAVAPEQATDPS